MKILIIEDQADKREEIKNYILMKYQSDVILVDKESLRGGLKEITLTDDYDLILLDMSMPNFDPSSENQIDSSPESFAGKELLEQMRLRDISIPVIVITQYSAFVGGTVSLESLAQEFENKYDFYLGSVYFNSASDTWKSKLSELLRGLND